MKTHTSDFKDELKNMGRQIDSIITYGNTTLNEELYQVTPHYEASLLKSVMKQLDIESSVSIPIGTVVNCRIGLKINNSFEYLDYGNYVVYSIEKIEDADSYKMVCYDKMLYSMKPYEDLEVTYPITIRNYINALCTKIGLTFKDINTQFANYDKEIQNELYLDADGNSLGYTYRDVLDELAQVTASIICIDNATDKVQIKYLNQTNDTIDEEYLKDVNVVFGEKYGPVNTIVLSRSAGADNIYYPSTLPANPCAIKISDNQIMNGNDRDTYMSAIYNKLNGIEFYLNDFSSIGILYYDLGDMYNISIGSATYNCLMLNDEINITQGIEEIIHTDLLEESETEYEKSDSTDRRINQTYLIVNKHEQEITALISRTTEIEQEIETITDTTGQAEGKTIYIDDSSDNTIISAKFDGETSQVTRSGINLYEPLPNNTVNTVSLTYNSDGSYTINGTSTTAFNFEISSRELEAGNYTLQCKYTGTLPSNSNARVQVYSASGFFSIGNNSANDAVAQKAYSSNLTDVRYRIRIEANFNYQNVKIYPLLVKGTYTSQTMPAFEPYGTMPSPDYPSEIVNLKTKNLLKSVDSSQTINGITFNVNQDKTITLNGTATANALLTIYGEWSGTTIYQKLDNSKYYTISGSDDSNIQVFIRTTDGSTISSHNPQSSPTFTGQIGIVNYFIQVLSGTVCNNVIIKPQLEEGSVATEYVPYNNLEIKAVNKNIFNKNVIAKTNGATKTVIDTGVRTTITNAGNFRYFGIEIGQSELLSKTITISSTITPSSNNNGCVTLYFGNSSSMAVTGTGITITETGSYTGTLASNFPTNCDRLYALIYGNRNGTGNVNDYVDYTNLQVEIGTGTTYEEHKEQIVYFPLVEGQKLYEGSYLANNGIHHLRGQYVITGNETINVYSSSTYAFAIDLDFIPYYNATETTIVCSHLQATDANNLYAQRNTAGNNLIAVGGQWSNKYHLLVMMNNYNTANDVKNYLTGQYSNGTPVTVEYDLAEEEIIPYNTDQQAAWNNIMALMTYKNITNIYSDAYAHIDYVKDNGLDIYETKASAKLTKQDVAQLKIDNDSIKTEVSSTKSSLSNYYTKDEADSNIDSAKAELQNVISQNKTEIEQTATDISLRVSSIETNGVDKVQTTMGYTFDDTGLNIDKTGAATASKIDNEAFTVTDKTANQNVFFAGYVSDQNSNYRGQTIVQSTNLVVKNYLNIEGASRFQPYVNPTLGGHGTGAFDIG